MPPSKGRDTSNIYAEPDFYAIDIAKNYPLVRSQPMFPPSEENNEASKYVDKDKVVPTAAKQAVAPA